MSAGPRRSFSSIGEVLELLREEFPDITISKIRFLESQGLLDPERTPSGYRKFYDQDIERLRWILQQQKEKFLPLKVIKDRLLSNPEQLASLALPGSSEGHLSATPDRSNGAPAGGAASPQEQPAQLSGGDGHEQEQEGAGALAAELTAISFTAEELGSAAGLTAEQLVELERYGLLQGRSFGGTTSYDADALVVARAAAAFARHGVEPRHLRMYRTAVEREAALFGQLVLPFVRQRQPAARKQASDTLAELARLGEGLRGALLRSSLRDAAGNP